MDEKEELIGLDKVGVGESAYVMFISADDSMRKRYYDIGLLPGTKIDCLMKKGTCGMRAYRIRGAVIAIRMSDIRNITVSLEGA